MNVFISGGCKNGKSYYAQRIAKALSEGENLNTNASIDTDFAIKQRKLYYVATMRPSDDEDRARIKRHIGEREGWGFITIEQPEKICECLEHTVCDEQVDKKGVFLLDSVTALLSNEMFREDGTVDLEAPERLAKELCKFAMRTGNTVFVSDYIYSDAILYDELTEKYRKGLALIDKELAKICDEVIEVSYSQITWHKRGKQEKAIL